MSVRESVLADFNTALQNIADAIEGVKVDRNLDIEVSDFPAAIQFDGGHDVEQDDTGVDRHTLRIDVECYVEAALYSGLAAAIDAMYVAVVAAVLSDYGRNDLASDTRLTGFQDPIIERAEGQGATAAFLLTFEVDFWTTTNDPTTKAP